MDFVGPPEIYKCAEIITYPFYVLLTVHLNITLINNQIDAQFLFMYVYFYALHVSGSHVPIIRKINCVSTGIYHSV